MLTDHTRRGFVAGSALTAGAVLLDGPSALAKGFRAARPKVPVATRGGFSLGVSSGFPNTTGAVLWTRVDDLAKSSLITLEISTDKGFRKVVQRKQVTASSVRDFTARTQVKGLKPGTEYFYRFHTKKTDSMVGRLRTLRPADSAEPVRVGVLSCQSYEAGYYTAIAGLAAEPDLDLVLHLGDYIYEHHFYDGPAERKDTTGPNKDGDVQTLAEFRAKYRLYKSDPDLIAMHAAHPFVSIWDDHEVEDNYAGDRPDSASTDPENLENDNEYPRRVPFAERQRAGYLSYFEYMPRIRKANDTTIYGSIPLGANATVFLTDQRQYRTPQPCNDALLAPCLDGSNPASSMLGAKQKTWFKNALRSDKAKWKLWASEVMLMSLDAAPGLAVNQDGWDGYAAERAELLNFARSNGIKNLVALTGDIHTYAAGTMTTTGRASGTPVGTEFVGGSVSSLGLSDIFGPAAGALALLPATNPHLAYLNTERRGYMVVEATADRLDVAFRSPASTLVAKSPVTTLKSFSVASGSTRVVVR
ncbi:Alkaline phosphatase D [Paraconexibacter sp. AEG42_29]|uniref:Alkaline phosphatase D n=1 Tax=Paraconexibacter sp. AEG42_29 TaxID=2997339 RepID=A0AAU7AT58_9ACTN